MSAAASDLAGERAGTPPIAPRTRRWSSSISPPRESPPLSYEILSDRQSSLPMPTKPMSPWSHSSAID